jgi:hypothetical protein
MVFCEGTDHIIHTIYEFANGEQSLDSVVLQISQAISTQVEIFVANPARDHLAHGAEWERVALEKCWFSDAIKPKATATCENALLMFRPQDRIEAPHATLSIVAAERDDIEGGFRFKSGTSEFDYRLLMTVIPHLLRAVRIFHKRNNLQSDAALLAGALEVIPAPVILVSKGLRVLGMNTQAQVFLNKSGELRVRRGRLRVQRSTELLALESAVNSAIQDGLVPEQVEGLAEDSSYSVSISQGARDIEVLAMPIRQASTNEFGALLVLNAQPPTTLFQFARQPLSR